MSNLCPCYKSFSILLRVCRGDFPRLCHGDHSQLLIDNPVKALIYRGDTTNWLWGQSLAGTYHGQVGGEVCVIYLFCVFHPFFSCTNSLIANTLETDFVGHGVCLEAFFYFHFIKFYMFLTRIFEEDL